jgi:hypothetical protein
MGDLDLIDHATFRDLNYESGGFVFAFKACSCMICEK